MMHSVRPKTFYEERWFRRGAEPGDWEPVNPPARTLEERIEEWLETNNMQIVGAPTPAIGVFSDPASNHAFRMVGLAVTILYEEADEDVDGSDGEGPAEGPTAAEEAGRSGGAAGGGTVAGAGGGQGLWQD